MPVGVRVRNFHSAATVLDDRYSNEFIVQEFVFGIVPDLLSAPVRNDRNFAGLVAEPLAGTRYVLYSSF